MDGVGNNPSHPDWGVAGKRLVRTLAPEYADGMSALAGEGRPNPRAVSTDVFQQETMTPDPRGLTDFVWAWGQYLDHDVSHTPDGSREMAVIPVPAGDAWFDPQGLGLEVIPFVRSTFVAGTGDSVGNPREMENMITAFIDASMVYGSSDERCAWLRADEGGLLRVQGTAFGDFPPFADDEIEVANPMGLPVGTLLACGDVRAAEQPTLMALHTLFVREHNRVASELSAAHPAWSDEELFQRARKIVGGITQAITYYEYLPALLGESAIPPYAGYDDSVNPSVTHEFQLAAFRMGHSQVNPLILRVDSSGLEIPEGHLNLFEGFFRASVLMEEAGMEPLFRGLAAQTMQKVDSQVIDDLRNLLFFAPLQGGLDLASLNIQRGRDHGLPGYNDLRERYGLERRVSFDDVTGDGRLAMILERLYGDVDEIDAWVGVLSEDREPGASVGETARAILADQFTRLRDGDRFYFERDPELLAEAGLVEEIRSTRLSDVIRRNTGVGSELPDAVFVAPKACPADVDGDGDTDLDDFSVLAVHFGDGPTPRAEINEGDLNDDGSVDLDDFSVLVLGFGCGT